MHSVSAGFLQIFVGGGPFLTVEDCWYTGLFFGRSPINDLPLDVPHFCLFKQFSPHDLGGILGGNNSNWSKRGRYIARKKAGGIKRQVQSQGEKRRGDKEAGTEPGKREG